MARALGLAGGEAVSVWERGGFEPMSAALLDRLAEVLGVAVPELLRREGRGGFRRDPEPPLAFSSGVCPHLSASAAVWMIPGMGADVAGSPWTGLKFAVRYDASADVR